MTDQNLLAAILRTDLVAFIQKTFATLTPNKTLFMNWHIRAIAYYLERVRRGEIKRLIINVPPRSLKSIIGSVGFPAFVLGRDPTKRVLCVSYSQSLAIDHANMFRIVVNSPWYRRAWPSMRLSPIKNTETKTQTTQHGFRLATSVDGTLTGRGGDIIIIDDPLKADDANSKLKREAVNTWYANTLLSRLDNKQEGAIIVIMQRLHQDDLVGHLLRSDDEEWHQLILPAIAEVDDSIPLSYDHAHYRPVGDVLNPAHEPRAILDHIKRTIGSDMFAAQYQQAPVPPGGAMIKRKWLQRYDDVPLAKHKFILQSWDTASKEGGANDWSVCTTRSIVNNRFYLLDVTRQRVSYTELRRLAAKLHRYFGSHQSLSRRPGSGTAYLTIFSRRHTSSRCAPGRRQNSSAGFAVPEVRSGVGISASSSFLASRL